MIATKGTALAAAAFPMFDSKSSRGKTDDVKVGLPQAIHDM
ncbi:hypothetical protein [Oceaniovalibus sp. ACAM 378]|nr:hypothetical protein [Oceaniovalibus sp. ACAM 378]